MKNLRTKQVAGLRIQAFAVPPMHIQRIDIAFAEQQIDVGNGADIGAGDIRRRAANQQPAVLENCRRIGNEL
jgi:hypothetical protein